MLVVRRAASRYADCARLLVARHLQEVGADGHDAVVPGHPFVVVERRQEFEPGLGPLHHRDRDRAVERDHRIGRDPLEEVVEHEDLQPVGVRFLRGFVVHGGDRGLELIRAERRGLQRVRDERHALLDAVLVPERTVLLREWDQRAVGAGTRRAPRVREQHEREQPRDFAVVGEQAMDLAGEADRFSRSGPPAAGRGPTSRCSPR